MTNEEMLKLTWKELNAAVLGCVDEDVLERWLAAEMAAGRRTRSKRIMSRLGAVRRAKALAALPPKAKRWVRRKKQKSHERAA